MPEAVETLHCPTCLCRLVDGGETRCPACRAPISKSARPLPLLERELQARIEAKTATHLRDRRRAAKTAKRIASLPPTIFEAEPEPQPVRPDTSPPEPPLGKPSVVDIPASSVHEVRSTNEVSTVAPPRVLFVEEAPEPVPTVEEVVDPGGCIEETLAPIAMVDDADDPMRFIEEALEAGPTGVAASDEGRRIDAGSEPEPVAPAPVAGKSRARGRIRVVERLAERVAEKVVERVTERVAEHSAARVPEPVAEAPVRAPVERSARRVAERPAPRFQHIGPRVTVARPAAPAAERVVPEAITRIGAPPSVNSVWRDRVFNSANQRADRAMWPRQLPRQPVAPVIDLPAEPVIDRIGEAAG